MKKPCRKAAFFALLAPALALTSCQAIEFDLRGIDQPVVLGDRLHVGPNKEFRVLTNKKRKYQSEVYKARAAAAGSSSRQVGNMVETTSFSAREDWYLDNSRSEAAKHLASHPNAAIRRVRIQVYNWFLNGLIYLSGKTGLKAKGDVVDRYGSKSARVLAQNEEASK